MLAATYLNPDREYSITELAQIAGASVNAAQREVARLLDAGYLTSRRVGTSRYVRAMTNSVISKPLTDLLAVTYGPLPVLSRALEGVEGIEHALIHGSWAVRYQGEPGPVPGDVDLIVIGDIDVDELDDAITGAEKVLRREVNVIRIRSERWQGSEDPFVETVRARATVEVPIAQELAK